MNNQACQCPGLKLGHQKTTMVPHNNPRTTEGADTNRIVKANYVGKTNHSQATRNGFFRLPDYEPSRLERLPTTQQQMFDPKQLTGMLDDFSRQMNIAIENSRIQIPPSIQLGLNPMGNILVEGNHPMQMKIEQLFNITPLLEKKFHEIAFTSRVQQLADLQANFKSDFFQLAPHSAKQITLVQMRSVELKPFRLVIERADTSAIETRDTARPKELPEQRYTIDRPKAATPHQPEPDKEERRHVHKGKTRCIIDS